MSTEGREVLRVGDLAVKYGDVRVLEGVNWGVRGGRLVGIVGPNGAGKSTLLRAILGLVPKERGEIWVEGGVRGVVYVPQRSSVDWDFPVTVGEVVKMGRYGVGRGGWWRRMGEEDRRVVKEALGWVGMEGMEGRGIGELSGGQQQRVFLARALARGGGVYLMDEPFVGVDAATEGAIIGVLKRLRGEGKAVVVVNHDLSTVRHYFDDVLLLNKRVVASGPVGEVFVKEKLQEAYGGRLMVFGEGGEGDSGWVVGG